MRNPKLKGIITFDNNGRTFQENSSQPNWYVFPYLAREFSGELCNSPEGTLIWVPNNKIHIIDMWEGDRIFVPLIMEDKGYFSARFVYEKISL